VERLYQVGGSGEGMGWVGCVGDDVELMTSRRRRSDEGRRGRGDVGDDDASSDADDRYNESDDELTRKKYTWVSLAHFFDDSVDEGDVWVTTTGISAETTLAGGGQAVGTAAAAGTTREAWRLGPRRHHPHPPQRSPLLLPRPRSHHPRPAQHESFRVIPRPRFYAHRAPPRFYTRPSGGIKRTALAQTIVTPHPPHQPQSPPTPREQRPLRAACPPGRQRARARPRLGDGECGPGRGRISTVWFKRGGERAEEEKKSTNLPFNAR
jgi:hypothetical protein